MKHFIYLAYVVSKKDIDELKETIIELIENEELRKSIAINAKDYAYEHFDAEKVRDQFRSILTSANEREKNITDY